MSDEQAQQEGRRAAPNRTPSGTISLDDSSILSRNNTQKEEEIMVASSEAAAAAPPPLRPRLYSEEDDDLRKAKAMALAIQQNPNMTPDEIHQLHFGDEAQSQILKQAKKQSVEASSSFLGSITKSQKKTKELFSSIVMGTTTTATPQQQQQQQRGGTSESTSPPALHPILP